MIGIEQSSYIMSSLKENILFNMDLANTVPATRNTEMTKEILETCVSASL